MTSSMPSEEELHLAYRSGPAGAALAARWLDAVIAGLPSKPLRESPDAGVSQTYPSAVPSRPRARRLSATDPERYGWRWWVLRPTGALASPIVGAEVAAGNTFDAHCDCGSPASPDCECGIHYALRAGDLLRHPAWQQDTLGPSNVLAYGVAVGAVEVDQTRHVDMASYRCARWHMLTLLVPGVDPARQAALSRRYECEVIAELSPGACRVVSRRLRSSLSAARMAELARRSTLALH